MWNSNKPSPYTKSSQVSVEDENPVIQKARKTNILTMKVLKFGGVVRNWEEK